MAQRAKAKQYMWGELMVLPVTAAYVRFASRMAGLVLTGQKWLVDHRTELAAIVNTVPTDNWLNFGHFLRNSAQKGQIQCLQPRTEAGGVAVILYGINGFDTDVWDAFYQAFSTERGKVGNGAISYARLESILTRALEFGPQPTGDVDDAFTLFATGGGSVAEAADKIRGRILSTGETRTAGEARRQRGIADALEVPPEEEVSAPTPKPPATDPRAEFEWRIATAEIAKTNAVEAEDFETAGILRDEIAKLRAELAVITAPPTPTPVPTGTPAPKPARLKRGKKAITTTATPTPVTAPAPAPTTPAIPHDGEVDWAPIVASIKADTTPVEIKSALLVMSGPNGYNDGKEAVRMARLLPRTKPYIPPAA